MGVARLVRARHRPPRSAHRPLGVDGGAGLAHLADHRLPADRRRREPGPHHRRQPRHHQQHHAHDEHEHRQPRDVDPVPEQAPRPHQEADRADGGPRPGRARLDVDREAEQRPAPTSASPSGRRGQHGQAVGGQGQQHRPGGPRHPDPDGEELEDDQGQADDQQQVGDRRAGGGVQQPLDQRQLGEADLARGLGLRLAVGRGDHPGRVELPPADLLARRARPGTRRWSGRPASTSPRSRAASGPSEPGVAVEAADPGAGRHARVGGRRHQPGRPAVGPGPRRADPHRHRHRRVGDAKHQLIELLAVDQRPRAVHLEDDDLGVGVLAPSAATGPRSRPRWGRSGP